MAKRVVNRSFASQIDRQEKDLVQSIPAPVGGLNGRDSLANMAPTDAVTLENFFPDTSSVKVRYGSSNWATGLPGWVETLMPYNYPSASKMFGISNGSIYDVTLTGAVGAPVVTGLSNSRSQYVNFATSGTNYLYSVNGSDSPELYNGTTWQAVTGVSAPVAITGVTTSTFVHINAYKQRLFFIPISSTSFWYLPVNSVGGAASQFDLGPLLKLGGYLNCMCTWSVDNAAGMQEYAVFISSEGEVLVYQGTDPTYAATWGLVSRFRIGRPMGRRCYVTYGSDVILLGADGAVPLSQAMVTSRASPEIAISDKIISLISSDVMTYATNYGWQIMLYPIGQKLIINVPQVENGTQYQYVMNTITMAWCKFTAWNAVCFETLGDKLFYGGNSVVVQADVGNADNGGYITAIGKPAFNYFGTQSQKMFSLVRPIFNSDGTVGPSIGLCLDFNDTNSLSTPTYSGSTGADWNTSPWDTTAWGGVSNTLTNWVGVRGIGFTATIKMQVQAANINVMWQSTDYVYERGGVL